MNPKVFIIVLQYNNSADTLACLESLKDLTYTNRTLVFVDNASRPEDRQALQAYLDLYDQDCHFIESPHNTGYAGGNNLGLRYALNHAADYVLILNNDTRVEPDLLEKLLEKAQSEPAIGIVGPAINEGDRTTYGAKVHWLKAELEHNYSFTRPGQEPDFLTGACILIKRAVLERIGLFDERYFLYFEDADYCLRAKSAGFRLALEPEAIIHHDVSSSTKKLGSPLLFRYHYRNAHLFNAMHGSVLVKLILPIWSIYIIVKQLLKLALRPDTRQIDRAILMGVIDFYRSKFGKIRVV